MAIAQHQRRQRQRDVAVSTLREALRTFDALGTQLWAERAMSGMTNRDIAIALFISPKTVEVNLSRVYRKLNVRSRTELYRAWESAKASPAAE